MRIVRLKDFSARPSMAGSGRHSEKTGKIQVVPRLLGHSINARESLLTPAVEVIGGLLGLGEVFKPKLKPGPAGDAHPPPGPPVTPAPPAPTTPNPVTSSSTSSSEEITTSIQPTSTTRSSSTSSTSTRSTSITHVSTIATTSSLPSTESRGTQSETPRPSSLLSSSSQFSTLSTLSTLSTSPSPLSPPPPPPPPPVGSTSASLSPSAIAGIVVGVVIGMMIIIFLTLFCLRRRRAMKAVPPGLSFEKAYPYPFTSPTAAAGVTRSIGRPISPPSPESIRAFNPSLMVSPGQPPPIRSSSSLRSLRSIGRVLLATRRDPPAPYLATPQESPPSPSKTSVEQGIYGGRSRWSTTAEGDLSLSSANSISTSEESGSTVRKPLPNPFDDSSSVSAESESSDQSPELRFRTP